MSKEKEKSRSYSIYLLKDGVEPSAALEDGHDLEKVEDAEHLPANAILYVMDSTPKEPWWKKHFGIKKEIKQVTKGAIAFFPAKDRWFALTFGNVYHQLDDYAYEYDFGLKVTLNSLDPNELKSADSVQPGEAKRRRTQVPNSTDLTYLDFDGNSEIIRALTGKVREEFRELFKNATGAASLKVSMSLSLDEMSDTCSKLVDLYNNDSYKELFPNIQNISPIKDPAQRDKLTVALMDAFRSKSQDISLTIPDVVDYRDRTCCIFRAQEGESDVYPDISIDEFYQFIEEYFDLEDCDVDLLRKVKMVLTDADGVGWKSYNCFRCLIFEFHDNAENALFHFCDGQWFRVEESFLKQLTDYIDERCEDYDICAYNHDKEEDGKLVYSEGTYNKGVEAHNSDFICLDLKDISPAGESQVEPCDLYTTKEDADCKSGRLGELVHVKISTRSASLSHLFNQGANSMHLIKREPTSKEKFRSLVESKLDERDPDVFLAPIDDLDFKVIFGVITHKNPDEKSKNLPLFSKISLMRCMQDLFVMDIPSGLVFIPDQSPKKEGHPKYDTIEVEVCVDAEGNVKICLVENGAVDQDRTVSHCCAEVREGNSGDRFKVSARKQESGNYRSHHTWPFEKL